MLELTPIGRVRSPYREQPGTPVQPVFGDAAETGRVEIDEPFREGLRDLEGFERIWLITWLERSRPCRLVLKPYREDVERGLFATRAPSRPNPVGLSCVELRSVDREAGVLEIGPLDLLDGTPVLDVKPYLPDVDAFPDARSGWFGRGRRARDRADDRFAPEADPPA